MKLLSKLAACAALVLVTGSALRADVYEDLRQKWVINLTGGNYTIDSAITTKIDALDALVALRRSEMTPGTPPSNGYLFPFANEVAASRGETQRHAHITSSYEALAKMAIALRTKGSDYEFIGTGSALAQATRDDIKRGLAWMYLYAYQNNTTIATDDNLLHNWWDLEIGSTGWLGSILCCLSTGPFLGGANGGLEQTEIDTYSRPMVLKLRNRTLLNGYGANGAWRARTWTYLGMLRKEKDENLVTKNYFTETKTRLDGVLASPPPDVTTFNSEGFHPDGTFLGHIFHPYTGSYGAQMIDRLIELDEFYTGTDWATAGTLKAAMLAWIAASDLQTYNLQFFQNVRGRSLTRYSATNAQATGLCLTTIWVAESASPSDQQVMRSLVKNWLISAPSVNLLDNAALSIPQYLRTKRYYDNHYASTVALATKDTYKQFPYGSMGVVMRPNYGASVTMFTADNIGGTRPHIKSNESLSQETVKGGFLGNGALQVLTADHDAFANGYYENIDWQRIPGTTIDRDLQPTGERHQNATNWAGGVGAGRFGVTGFQLQPKAGASAAALGEFHARKAWFFFDEEIVALGADIRRTNLSSTHKIHTILENRKIRADNGNTFKVNGSTTSTTLSSSDIVAAATTRAWVSGNGVAANTDMGYYFPNPTEVTYRREQRTTTPPTPAPAVYVNSAKFLTMWINHGVPSAGGYQYMLLPGFTEAQTNAFATREANASTRLITVLANTASAQAVRKVMPAPTIVEQDETLDVTGALFLNDANTPITLPGSSATHVRSTRQGALMVEETEAKITVRFSDVTWQQTGVTTLEIGRKVSGWETKSSTASITSTYPNIVVDVNVSNAKGAAQEIVFHKRHEFGYEDDGLPLVASSGDAFVNYLSAQAGADSDRLYSYNANATGDYATFKAWHQMAGSYKAVLRFKKASNRGKVKVYLGTTSTPTTQIGSEIDLYNATETFEIVEIPLAAFATSGDRFIKFEVTGKNATSGGYRVVLDSLEFRPL